MKKIIFILITTFMIAGNIKARAKAVCSRGFNTAFTTGYVFKPHDAIFRDVYGIGMVDVITADASYQPWNHISFGTKLSYWLASGHTTFTQRKSFLQEIPMTVYIKGIVDFCRGLRLYASIGGGTIWMKEGSYLDHLSQFRGIGEAEIGLNYSMKHRVNFTTAFRYLFPRQKQGINRINVGGLDLRAGLNISF